MRARFAVLPCVAAAMLACRDGISPYVPPLPGTPAAVRQLTFGTGQDRDPRWSPTGESLLYHTSSFGVLPEVRGVLLTIPPEGGAAATVFPEVHRAGRLLATPAYSPGGTRIAYVDLVSVETVVPCSVGEIDPEAMCQWSQPLLDSARLRVRDVGESRNFNLDPNIVIRFPGPDPRRQTGEPGPYVTRTYPFQAEHRLNHAMLFRPSWAPDGERLVYSNGIGLFIWRVGDATATPVPGTADAVSAAWSPDGQWIAYTRLVRGDSIQMTCPCNELEVHHRTIYRVADRQLVMVRPDGSDSRTLGPGEDPAWSPDGQHIFVSVTTALDPYASDRFSSQIVRVPVAGGPAVLIQNTTRGRSPAVSPDGRSLAFARARSDVRVDFDIWVVSLTP